jgi:hypothetical protein
VTPPPGAPPLPPTRGSIARAIAIALVVAAAILVIAILPAEYGIDPLGTGRMLGLNRLHEAAGPSTQAATTAGDPKPASAESLSAGATHIPQNAKYRVHSIELTLGPFQFIEHKYNLDKGASMIYSWSSTGPVMYDLHTEPAGKPPEASESFAMGTATEGHGSYTAPYAGLHGWYIENKSETESIKVRIQAAGYFTGYRQYYDDETHKDFPISE